MAVKDGCEGCDHGSFCFCNVGKVLAGILVFIVVLALVFWLVRTAMGVAFGLAAWTYSPLGVIVGVITFLVVFWLILWIVRIPFRMFGHGGRKDLRIIRRRYARGEINEAQFKRMMKNLKEHDHN